MANSNQSKLVNSCFHISITALCSPPLRPSPEHNRPYCCHYYPRSYFERILYHAISRFHLIEFENNARRSRVVRFAACHIEIFVRGDTENAFLPLQRTTERQRGRMPDGEGRYFDGLLPARRTPVICK